ncbi:MAG TPA: GDSL-type esterase/lipase family protein [Opitutaceae bacterium]|jgi:lysophospholipase L1-like esterase
MLLFIGDSVTDCGRLQPVGRGPAPALGHGYVAQVDAGLRSPRAGRLAEVVNMGTSGNTVRDLSARWDRDVVALRPSWLCVLIGTNDVWRQFDGRNPPAAVMPDEFGRTYDALLSRTRLLVEKLVLMTPFYVQDDRGDPMRRRMDEYGAMARWGSTSSWPSTRRSSGRGLRPSRATGCTRPARATG